MRTSVAYPEQAPGRPVLPRGSGVLALVICALVAGFMVLVVVSSVLTGG